MVTLPVYKGFKNPCVVISDMVKSDVSNVTVHDGIVKSTCSDVIWMQTQDVLLGVNLIPGVRIDP